MAQHMEEQNFKQWEVQIATPPPGWASSPTVGDEEDRFADDEGWTGFQQAVARGV